MPLGDVGCALGLWPLGFFSQSELGSAHGGPITSLAGVGSGSGTR